MMKSLSLFIASAVAPSFALVSPGGTGRLPAMGWNSWNEYACDINEDVFVKVSELMVSLGLKDLGYNYVNIDDCWSDKEKRRDSTTGEIIPDYTKFPKGISHVAERVHELGLKLGIYSDAGSATCGGFEGSLGHEETDAATFAKWGIDYLKYDNCNVPDNWTDKYPYDPADGKTSAPANYDWNSSKTSTRYHMMRDALLAQEHEIQYSLCAWGHAHVEQWGNSTGHSWRMWGDIYPAWDGKYDYSWGLMPIVNQAARMWNYTGFWGHNDWDMLEVGNGNLTIEENRSHFALWAALKSPLIIGTPLDTIKDSILEILSNKEIIDFNQDTHYSDSVRPFKTKGIPDTTADITDPTSHWVGTSVKGIHIFLLNTAEEADMHISFADVPGLRHRHPEYLVHDMWTGKDLGVFGGEMTLTVKTHDTAALRFTTVDGDHPNPNWTPTSRYSDDVDEGTQWMGFDFLSRYFGKDAQENMPA